MIKNYLNQLFPKVTNPWNLILLISIFIPLFILVFQPFGLSTYQGANKLIIIAGYGCVTFVILILNLFLIPWWLKKWFDEKSWTVLKQILCNAWILFTIGLGNYVYSSMLFSIFHGIHGLLLFQFYTLVIGIIPVTVLTILQQNVWLSQNLQSARDLTENLQHEDPGLDMKQVCLIGDNQKEKFAISVSNLCYIESTGNYIKIYYDTDNKLKNTVLRCALKRAELQLGGCQQIVRCHRAFMVNVFKIIQVKGNSQGLRLVLKHVDTDIPVSRNLSKKLKEQMHASFTG